MILVIENIDVRFSCSSEFEKRKTCIFFISAFYSDLTALTRYSKAAFPVSLKNHVRKSKQTTNCSPISYQLQRCIFLGSPLFSGARKICVSLIPWKQQRSHTFHPPHKHLMITKWETCWPYNLHRRPYADTK